MARRVLALVLLLAVGMQACQARSRLMEEQGEAGEAAAPSVAASLAPAPAPAAAFEGALAGVAAPAAIPDDLTEMEASIEVPQAADAAQQEQEGEPSRELQQQEEEPAPKKAKAKNENRCGGGGGGVRGPARHPLAHMPCHARLSLQRPRAHTAAVAPSRRPRCIHHRCRPMQPLAPPFSPCNHCSPIHYIIHSTALLPPRYDPETSYTADMELSLRDGSMATVGPAPTATGTWAAWRGWLGDRQRLLAPAAASACRRCRGLAERLSMPELTTHCVPTLLLPARPAGFKQQKVSAANKDSCGTLDRPTQ